MLPSVTGYLLGTRQPIDYTGKAIDAFTQVSAELRATRAQNLAESQEARQAGQQAFERPMQAAQFQDDMLNSEVSREVAIGNLEMRAMEHKFKMETAQWERQNLLPLEIDYKKAQIDNYNALADSRRYEIETDRKQLEQFRGEANDIGRALQLVQAGPQEGEDASVHMNRIRDANALLKARKEAWKDTKNPAIQGFFSSAESTLRRQPLWQYLNDRGDLATEEEKQATAQLRQTAFDAKMPFRSDADRNLWMGENQQRWENAKSLPEESFNQWLKDESTRVAGDRRFNPEPGDPTPTFKPTAQQAEAIYKLHAAVNQGKETVNVFGDGGRMDEENGIPVRDAIGMLRGMGIPDNLLPSVTLRGETPSYFPQSPGSRGRVSRDSATPAEGEEGAAQGLIDIINGKL